MRDGPLHSDRTARDGDGDEVEARPGLQIGRYQLLTAVGAGGMGVVWGAWDPELERRVAIKLVQQSSPQARARILREGKSLARLSHPNIVPLYDVGAVGDTLYLVMEWVRGATLRALPDGAPILDAYLQAGAGLAAAHAAGVIHRDFKPDNAIRGDDGRVRVLDFGIAVAVDGGRGERAGTRRYMAPEQVRGEAVTAAADQYAFAVALTEALERAGDVPRRMVPLLARARADDPAARYPALTDLLAALARDPRARRRHALFAGAVALAGAGAFALGATRSSADAPAIEACSGAAAELAGTWGPARRDAVLAPLRAHRPSADVEGVAAALDAFAEGWSSAQRDACLSHRRGELTVGLYEQRHACLARTRARFDAVVELLGDVEATAADGVVLATRSLPDAAACAGDPSVVPPSAEQAAAVRAVAAQVERALVHVQAHRPQAGALAQQAVASARSLGYPPLLARALLVEGHHRLMHVDEFADGVQGEATLTEAMTLALTAGDDLVALEAYARWLFLHAIFGHTDVGSWTAMIAIAERLGERGRFAHALLLNNRALAHRAAGDRSGARALLHEASVVRGSLRHPELLTIEFNLAMLAKPAEATSLMRMAYDGYRAALGEAHMLTLNPRYTLAVLEPDRSVARREVQAVCDAMAANGSDTHICDVELAFLAELDGDRAAAVAALTRTVERGIGSEPDLRSARAFLAAAAEDPGGARELQAMAADDRARPATSDWELSAQARRFAMAAWAADRRGDRDASTAAWRLALDRARAAGIIIDERLRAQASAILAERLAPSLPDEARALAAAALPWFRRSPADATLVARLARIAGE